MKKIYEDPAPHKLLWTAETPLVADVCRTYSRLFIHGG